MKKLYLFASLFILLISCEKNEQLTVKLEENNSN